MWFCMSSGFYKISFCLSFFHTKVVCSALIHTLMNCFLYCFRNKILIECVLVWYLLTYSVVELSLFFLLINSYQSNLLIFCRSLQAFLQLFLKWRLTVCDISYLYPFCLLHVFVLHSFAVCRKCAVWMNNVFHSSLTQVLYSKWCTCVLLVLCVVMVHGIVYCVYKRSLAVFMAVLINCSDIFSLQHGCHSDIFDQIFTFMNQSPSLQFIQCGLHLIN